MAPPCGSALPCSDLAVAPVVVFLPPESATQPTELTEPPPTALDCSADDSPCVDPQVAPVPAAASGAAQTDLAPGADLATGEGPSGMVVDAADGKVGSSTSGAAAGRTGLALALALAAAAIAGIAIVAGTGCSL